jgi:hypothetical protein
LEIGNTLGPLERAFAPRVIIAHYQDPDEHKHLEQRKLREREIVAHEDYRPGQQKDRFNVENQKQHRDDVIPNREPLVGFSCRIDTTFVRPHLALFVFDWPQKSTENNRQDGKDHGHGEKDHYRPISCYGTANGFCCRRYCLKKHRFLVQEERKQDFKMFHDLHANPENHEILSFYVQNSKRRIKLLSTTALCSHQCNFTARSI